MPTTTRTPIWLVSDQTGHTGGFQPRACSFRTTNGKATAAPASPAANVTEPITMALAASTRPRRGLAASVVRIMPRRYSPVMNTAPRAMMAIAPNSVP